MKTLQKLSENKELQKAVSKMSHYHIEQFAKDAERYIKAVKEERVICSIGSVSASGMSRTMKFLAPEKNTARKAYQYLNFFAFFKAMGFREAGKYGDYFRINGCGMDMVFHTNYTIIHRLQRYGFISKKQCEKLAQSTPQVI